MFALCCVFYGIAIARIHFGASRMIWLWLFMVIFLAFWTYMGVELYLYFRKPKDPDNWDAMSEWAWRRTVRKAIDEMLDEKQ